MAQDLTPNTSKSGQVNTHQSERVQKISDKIDNVSEDILNDLTSFQQKLDSLIDIMEDRMVQSTEAGFPIALARLGELRVDTIKKKIEVLKTLSNDKAVDVAAKKRSNDSGIEGILSGIGLGAALGANLGTSTISANSAMRQETKNVTDVEVIIEDLTPTAGVSQQNIDDLISGS